MVGVDVDDSASTRHQAARRRTRVIGMLAHATGMQRAAECNCNCTACQVFFSIARSLQLRHETLHAQCTASTKVIARAAVLQLYSDVDM